MIEYRTLEDIDFSVLHQSFLEAFSDYEVQLDLSMSQLAETLKRRGYDPKASICAVEGDKVVGFLLNAIRQWDGVRTAYDTGTAVIPNYRNQGLSSAMFQQALQRLRELDVDQYLLEVIQSNTPAIHLYEKQGFTVARTLECYRLDALKDALPSNREVEALPFISNAQWQAFQTFWDKQPSWQNAIDSIQALPNAFAYSVVKAEGVIVGYGVVDLLSGDVPQIAVAKAHRGKGIGSALIADLMRRTQATRISLVNVDEHNTSMQQFLQKVGATMAVKQYEMVLELTSR
ncbi:MAG: GNAT family N-acetyltransferase [Erysipelotrichaceae bacterium]